MKKSFHIATYLFTLTAMANSSAVHASILCNTESVAKNASIQFVEQNDLSDPSSQNFEIKTVQAQKDASDSGIHSDAYFITINLGSKGSSRNIDSTVINVIVDRSACKVLDLERSE